MSKTKVCIEEELIEALQNEDYTKAKKLLTEPKLNPNYISKDHNSLLHFAISKTVPTQIVETLIKRGANVNYFKEKSVYSVGETYAEQPNIMQTAIIVGRKDLLELLFKWNGKAKTPCADPFSLLVTAVQLNCMEIVQYLVEKIKVDILYVPKFNSSMGNALVNALKLGFTDIFLYLHSKSPYTFNPENFNTITKNYIKFLLDFLINHNAQDLNKPIEDERNEKNHNPLTFAVLVRHGHVAQMLYALGAKHSSSEHKNIIHIAIDSGSTQSLLWVLSKPEFLRNIDKAHRDSTPLGYAAKLGSQRSIKILLAHGATLDLISNARYCWNAMLEAANTDVYNESSALLLLDLGSNPYCAVGPAVKFRNKNLPRLLENYSFLSTFLNKNLIQQLASLVEAEYYRKTNDILRIRKIKLLNELIEKMATHSAPILLERFKIENQETMKQTILQRLNDQQNAIKTAQELETKLNEEYLSSLKAISEMMRTSLINKMNALLIGPSPLALQPYLAYLLAQIESSKSTSSYSPLRSLTSKLGNGKIESGVIYSFMASDLDNEFLPLYVLGAKDFKGVECSLDFNFANLSLNQDWQKFKAEKMALLQQLNDKRAEFALGMVKKYLAANAKSSLDKPNLQPNTQPKIVFSIAANNNPAANQTAPLSDKARHILQFFNLLEEQNSKEPNPALLELRNKLAAEVSAKTLQQAACLLLDATPMPAIDPKPLLLQYVKDQILKSEETMQNKPVNQTPQNTTP